MDAVSTRVRLGQAFLALFYLAPWAWLICFGIFTAAVTIAVGHFPSYSNPDPKHVDGLEPLAHADGRCCYCRCCCRRW